MPVYHHLGKIPHKRHTQFRNYAGVLYQEELVETQGFSGVSSLVYHLHPPTIVKEKGTPYAVAPEIAIDKNLSALSFKGFGLSYEADYLDCRKTLFVNQDLHIGLAAPHGSTRDYFFKNADADEMIFVHKGHGWINELAVMIDPFKPMQITKAALELEVSDYYKSWLEGVVI